MIEETSTMLIQETDLMPAEFYSLHEKHVTVEGTLSDPVLSNFRDLLVFTPYPSTIS